MTDNTEPLDLDAVEARATSATEGPWKAADCDVWTEAEHIFGGTIHSAYDLYPRSGYDRAADAVFIAHARTDVPALVAAVRERDEMLAKISAVVAAGTYSNRELREAIQYIANVIDRTDTREPRVTCFCGGDHITGSCLIHDAEEANR